MFRACRQWTIRWKRSCSPWSSWSWFLFLFMTQICNTLLQHSRTKTRLKRFWTRSSNYVLGLHKCILRKRELSRWFESALNKNLRKWQTKSFGDTSWRRRRPWFKDFWDSNLTKNILCWSTLSSAWERFWDSICTFRVRAYRCSKNQGRYPKGCIQKRQRWHDPTSIPWNCSEYL